MTLLRTNWRGSNWTGITTELGEWLLHFVNKVFQMCCSHVHTFMVCDLNKFKLCNLTVTCSILSCYDIATLFSGPSISVIYLGSRNYRVPVNQQDIDNIRRQYSERPQGCRTDVHEICTELLKQANRHLPGTASEGRDTFVWLLSQV